MEPHPAKNSKPVTAEKILFFVLVLLAISLALKSLKQFIFLSFTLLSLKIVWLLLIVLALLTFVKKKA